MFTFGQLLIFSFGLGLAGGLLMAITDKIIEWGWMDWL